MYIHSVKTLVPHIYIIATTRLVAYFTTSSNPPFHTIRFFAPHQGISRRVYLVEGGPPCDMTGPSTSNLASNDFNRKMFPLHPLSLWAEFITFCLSRPFLCAEICANFCSALPRVGNFFRHLKLPSREFLRVFQVNESWTFFLSSWWTFPVGKNQTNLFHIWSSRSRQKLLEQTKSK